jgi:hypothetical protein
MRRGASGTSEHVIAKSSICGWDALCKSGVRAVTVTCLTPGDLSGASLAKLGVEQSALNTVEKSAEGIVGGWLH